ncbi:glutathione synthase [Gammaproteobacteria bacterium]|nr:glutathione synthase [Gammaproteobacteria bacterium]
MNLKVGIIMDPIESINFKKDSSLALLLEASYRNYEIYYFEQKDLFIENGKAIGNSKKLKVFNDENKWFHFDEKKDIELKELDILLMRIDPPFNLEYIYTTYILELAQNNGALIINNPKSLRNFNEKVFTTWFPECGPETLVSKNIEKIKEFYLKHKDIVCKPLDEMGGSSIFRLTYPDINANVVFEVLSNNSKKTMMAQKYIPEITRGDKRIIVINGNPIPYGLSRIPAEGDLRGNLAKGASGVAGPLSDQDILICEKIAPTLKKEGLYLVGLDIIGNYLTEINITSPTCIRQLDSQCNLNISAIFFDFIESKLSE